MSAVDTTSEHGTGNVDSPIASTSPRLWSAALRDLAEGAARWRVCAWLGWSDAIIPMRKTIIGPFWVTIQSGLWVLIIVALLGPSLSASYPLYPVYVAAGIVFFQYITSMMVDGAAAFTRDAALILNIPNPLSVYILRTMFKSLILLAAQIPVILVAVIFVPEAISWTWILVAPGLVIVTFVLLGLSIFLASITPFYRDIPFALAAALRVLFFATPIFWQVEKATGYRALAAKINPIAHMLSLLRDPVLGAPPPLESVLLMIAAGILLWGVGLFVFSRTRLVLAAHL